MESSLKHTVAYRALSNKIPISSPTHDWFPLLRSITRFPGGPVDAVLNKAARRLNATPAQIIFLWVKAKGAVIVT